MDATAGTLKLRYVPIPAEIAESARRTRRDAFGHDLEVQRDTGPCRVCLRISEGPENVLLLSYQPLPDRNPYAEVGPIFIHEHECAPYTAFDAFPEDFAARELVLRAYDRGGRIFDAAVAPSGEGARVAAEFLSNADIHEVHVRHTSYTCFDFKIVRAPLSE
ncbi:MAG: hypothetical protein JWO85_2400 [Candidatus Eremiobacteraeota bacterium]|nr:hypothetical protein [Candidatus Eremiobacteraeota bacterium]